MTPTPDSARELVDLALADLRRPALVLHDEDSAGSGTQPGR